MKIPIPLTEYLSIMRTRTGAASACMLLHMEPPERQGIMLLTDGDSVVPELASEEAAWQLMDQWNKRSDSDRSTAVAVLPGAEADSLLIRLSFSNIMARPTAQRRAVNERRSQPDIHTAPSMDGTLWIGLGGCPDREAVQEKLGAELEADGERFLGELETGLLSSPTELSAKLAWSVYQLSTALQDPVSQLPGRMEFQVFLKRAIAAAFHHQQSISLLLVNPDDFTMINHRYGRQQGDLAVREIADALADCLRETDGVFRYGGAVFGVVLPATDVEQCRAAAEKVRRQLVQRGYLDHEESLTFSMGGAVAGPEDFAAMSIEVGDMLKHADVALNRAKLSGGGHIIIAGMTDQTAHGEDLNPLGGIFTADTEKDYRNMLLLWETVGLVSGNPEPGAMAAALVDRLATGFHPERIVLFSVDDASAMTPMATNVRDDAAQDGRASGREVSLDERRHELVLRSLDSLQVERLQSDRSDARTTTTAYAVPLIARDHAIGCLFLDGRGHRLMLDSSDVIFLTALASQIAVALDRAALAAGWIREKDRESRKLREELQELRQSMEQVEMVYESAEMASLMDMVQRVAPSSATVLITGESGTGKEMLAHSIHEYSDRVEGPFVVFDCGAVAITLLEAELFGHVKGAFTGAESASPGRIAQADGGTLFLDEIGELPLQVQAKLLRFVQEKEFSPVGSSRSEKVDVRLVAATNRRLQDEVAGGRFRSDLYYRLQVISLQAIPLRHRVSDILPLALYFLQRSAAQHGRQASLSEDARHKLKTYEWPGNVRELQNCMLRTVLTAQAEVVTGDDIELLPEAPIHTSVNLVVSEDPIQVAGRMVPPVVGQVEHGAERPHATPEAEAALEERPASMDPWRDLRQALLEQIETALAQNQSRPVPLGRWLTEDMVLAASSASNNVSRQAARRLGVPESTFRRHHQKASADRDAGVQTRTPAWSAIRQRIDAVIGGSSVDSDEDLLERARQVLLAEVLGASEDRISTGSALMGVTPPTYKRWVATRSSQ